MGWSYLYNSNFNASTVEVWELISNFILHITGHVITYPYWNYIWSMLVKETPGGQFKLQTLSYQYRCSNSSDHLIFIIGIPIVGRQYIDIQYTLRVYIPMALALVRWNSDIGCIVQCGSWYMVSFHHNTRYRQPLACPIVQDMGCFWNLIKKNVFYTSYLTAYLNWLISFCSHAPDFCLTCSVCKFEWLSLKLLISNYIIISNWM